MVTLCKAGLGVTDLGREVWGERSTDGAFSGFESGREAVPPVREDEEEEEEEAMEQLLRNFGG